jgi:hypothetical protein
LPPRTFLHPRGILTVTGVSSGDAAIFRSTRQLGRFRMVWPPAHQVPISTSCDTYSCSTGGGYWHDEQDFEKV